MVVQPVVSANNGKSKLVLILSLCTFTYWILSQNINVYQIAPLGALFELLWLPMLAALILLPVFSLVSWATDKSKKRLLYLFSALLTILTAILLLTVYR